MRYRRDDLAGGMYFFPVNSAERKRALLVDHIVMLRTVMRKVKTMHPFEHNRGHTIAHNSTQ